MPIRKKGGCLTWLIQWALQKVLWKLLEATFTPQALAAIQVAINTVLAFFRQRIRIRIYPEGGHKVARRPPPPNPSEETLSRWLTERLALETYPTWVSAAMREANLELYQNVSGDKVDRELIAAFLAELMSPDTTEAQVEAALNQQPRLGIRRRSPYEQFLPEGAVRLPPPPARDEEVGDPPPAERPRSADDPNGPVMRWEPLRRPDEDTEVREDPVEELARRLELLGELETLKTNLQREGLQVISSPPGYYQTTRNAVEAFNRATTHPVMSFHLKAALEKAPTMALIYEETATVDPNWTPGDPRPTAPPRPVRPATGARPPSPSVEIREVRDDESPAPASPTAAPPARPQGPADGTWRPDRGRQTQPQFNWNWLKNTPRGVWLAIATLILLFVIRALTYPIVLRIQLEVDRTYAPGVAAWGVALVIVLAIWLLYLLYIIWEQQGEIRRLKRYEPRITQRS